jgi:UDP-N-acetylmuramoyl-tripeptide--D-alanyl-D-alanine ligase
VRSGSDAAPNPPGFLDAVRPQKPGLKELRRSAGKLAVLPVARARRSLMPATRIGITGSAGKTTTKKLLVAMLASLGPVSQTPASLNRGVNLARTILGAGRADRFIVAELAAIANERGLDDLLWMLAPEVGLVTCVAHDHFANADEAARAKVRLVQALPRGGLAVLNADDPRVAAMTSETEAKIVSFGVSPDADVRAEEVHARWPGRLAFTLVTGGKRRRVETRLVGEVWLPSVLAALATSIELGVDPDRAVAIAAEVEPELGHLSVFEAPSGATFLEDVWKGSVHTVEPALKVLDRADEGRRVAVLGFTRHDARPEKEVYEEAIAAAWQHADLVVLAGPAAAHGRDPAAEAAGTLRAFDTVGGAARFLREAAQPGDLILLKSKGVLHLERVALAQTGEVTCERYLCPLLINCAHCKLLRA